MIGGGQNRVFKLHLIYPQKKSVERSGTVYGAPAGTGTGNYAHTGDWKLNEQEEQLLESRIRRSLGESGVQIESGMEVLHSPKGVDEFRTNWGPPTAELGIGNHEYSDEIVPVYLIRGLGAYAGGDAGAGFQNSYFTIGDGVIESLAGRKGVNGKTAYEIIKTAEEPMNAEFHKFNSSWQAQMGTVLHEGFHAVAALPHRDGVHDYAENYAGAHGEEFGKAIDDAMRGRAGTDRFAAMNLIMNEPWSYGWGQQPQGLPDQMPVTGRDDLGPVPRPGGVDAELPNTLESGSSLGGPGSFQINYPASGAAQETTNGGSTMAGPTIPENAQSTATVRSSKRAGGDRGAIASAKKRDAAPDEIKSQLLQSVWWYDQAVQDSSLLRVQFDSATGVWRSWVVDPVRAGEFEEWDAAVTQAAKETEITGITYRAERSSSGNYKIVEASPPRTRDYATQALADSQRQVDNDGNPVQESYQVGENLWALRGIWKPDRLQGYKTREELITLNPLQDDERAIQHPDSSWGKTRIREDAKEIDPDEPFFTEDDGETPKTIDLGGGRAMYFLTDGSTVVKQGAVDWEGAKEVTIGEEKFIIWPDGTKSPVGDKFQGGISPDDIALEEEIELKDGTFAAVFNNGQIFRTGREVKPAEVAYDPTTGRIQVTQPDGSLSFVDPVYPVQLEQVGGYNFLTQRTGAIQDIGLPQVPATIEEMAGQQFIRGTQGELVPLNDVLDRTIEMALINGDVDKAIAFDDFRKRPSRAEALQMALEFARSPADQVLISALSSGETHLAPPSPGELQRVGPQADFLVEAYDEFRASLTGGRLPTAAEFSSAMAGPPPPAPTDAEIAKLEHQRLVNEGLAQKLEFEKGKNQREIDSWNAAQAQQGAKHLSDQAIAKQKLVIDGQKAGVSTGATGSTTGSTTGGGATGGSTGGGATGGSTATSYDDDYDGSGDISVDGSGSVTQTGTTPMRQPPQLGGAIVNIATHLVEQFERGGYTLVDSSEGVVFEDPGPSSETASANQELWNGLSEDQKSLFGGSGDTISQNFENIANQGTLNNHLAGAGLPQIPSLDIVSPHEGGVRFSTDAEQAEAAQKGQDLRDAEKAGFLAKNYNNIGPNAVAAWKQSLADAQEQTDYEESMATQLTSLGIDTAAGDVTDQAGFFEALGLDADPDYTSVATALAPEGADVAEFIDPQGTAAAEAALEIQQENTARDTLLTDKQSEPDHVARSAMGGQSHADAMAEIRRIEEDYNLERLAGGGRVGSQEMAIVGESGPEVALLPHGTEVIPLDRNVQPDQARRLRRRGVRGMAEGGIVFDRYGGEMPSGVRRTVAGQSVDPSAGRLFRAAGLGVPSGQGLRNMLPEDLEIYQDLGAQAGIPEGSFQRELALGIPSGERQRGSARFLPLSLRS